MKRRLIRIAMMAAGVVLLLALALAVYVRFRPGSLQGWIGSQLESIANSYLNPQLSFTDLSYEYPLTVSLKNLRLTAPDPKQPGHTIDIIACNHAVLSLAEIPSVGKPIVIQKILLDGPLISAVAVEPRSPNFVGFSDLLRGGSTQTEEKSSSPSRKLSDVFQMRLVQLTNGKIVYDPRIPGTVPMTLDQINTTLNIEPTAEGWYKLDTDIARKPVFDLNLVGQLNLDTFSVRGVDIKLLADLGANKLDYLPPELQTLLKQYEAKGRLTAEVTGTMPITDPMKGHIQASLKVDGANIAMNGMRLPVQNLELNARFGDGMAQLSYLKLATLGGSVDLSGKLWLDDRLDSDLHLNIAGLVPEKLLANPEMMSPSPARIDLDLSLAASLMSIIGKAPPKPNEPLAAIGLHNLRISANDPAKPGHSIDVVACKNLEVAMTQPIFQGQPIVIDKIVLDQPSISAVSVLPGTNQFAGVPNLPATETENSSPSAAAQPAANPGDLVRIKLFQLDGAKIVYDPRIPGTRPMRLDDISATLKLDPDDPNFYRFSSNFSRKPAFNLAIAGALDVKNPGVQNLTLNLQADLTKNQLDFLPPQLQLILQQTRAKGKLNVQVAASVKASDPMKGQAQLVVDAQNIDLSQGNLRIPVDDFSMDARLHDGKIVQSTRIVALNNVLNISGSTTLNPRLDTDMTLSLKDVDIESLLAALNPNRPAPTTSTRFSADLEIRSPIMVAMGALPGRPGEPVAVTDVRNLRLTTNNPLTPGQPLDFFSCDHLGAALSSLPLPGSPIVIDHLTIEHPAIRAIAMQPGSNDLAGFAALRNLAPPGPTTAPAEPRVPPSDLFRLRKLSIADASLFYDPRLDNTVPMSFDHISIKADMDSLSGDRYAFAVNVPSRPDFNLDLTGGLNIDSLVVHPLTLDLTTVLGKDSPTYLPPQVQQILRPYDLDATVNVKVRGTAPLTDPTAADLTANVLFDNVTATVGDYRIPLEHVRLPVRLKFPDVEFLDSSSLGGPTLEAFGGTANLTGSVVLNDRLDTSLKLKADGMLLQLLMADKIKEPRMQLIGNLHAKVNLVNAPVMTVIAMATAPATQPSTTEPSTTQPVSASSNPLPVPDGLPANWGSADIQLTHARLAGLELVQGISNIAKSAFADLFKHQDKDQPEKIIPKETARIVCDFKKDHIAISNLHYEGEIVEADGKGYVSLDRHVDLNLTGGVIQKLGGLGSVGDWIKKASDSLLYYHVYGTFHDLNYEVKRGNGQPIVQGVKSGAKEGVKYTEKGAHYIGVGLGKTSSFFHGLFNKKSPDQNQDQSQDQKQNSNQGGN
jgi:hypothetical protein